MIKYTLAFILSLFLSGCGTTAGVGALAAIGTAATTFISSSSASPDYTKYADTCRLLTQDIVTYRTSRHTALMKAFDSKSPFIQGGAVVMLAMESKDDNKLFTACALQGPESFLQTLFKNTNVAQILLTVYQENRAGIRAQRQLEVQKALALANMEHTEVMSMQNNDLLKALAGSATDNFNAGAAAAASSGE